MQRYFMNLAYNGTPFHGWQSQPNAISVQSTIEQAMSTILRTPVKITGAGRTDTGVSARRMIAHFDLESPINHTGNLINALNSLLGKNVAVYSITPVHAEAHARFDATSRTYHYYTTHCKSPFFHPLSWQAPPALDYEAMNKAAELLLETDDFTSFAKLHTDNKTNICKVTHAHWHEIANGDGHVFIITADRFPRNMVRAVVGTLVDVGRGKITIDDFRNIIAARNRCSAGTSMPPQALYLWDITYPYYDADNPT